MMIWSSIRFCYQIYRPYESFDSSEMSTRIQRERTDRTSSWYQRTSIAVRTSLRDECMIKWMTPWRIFFSWKWWSGVWSFMMYLFFIFSSLYLLYRWSLTGSTLHSNNLMTPKTQNNKMKLRLTSSAGGERWFAWSVTEFLRIRRCHGTSDRYVFLYSASPRMLLFLLFGISRSPVLIRICWRRGSLNVAHDYGHPTQCDLGWARRGRRTAVGVW